MARKSSRNWSGIFFSLVAVAAIAVGVGTWLNHAPAPPKEDVEAPVSTPTPSVEVKPHRDKVKVYVVKIKKDDVVLEAEERSVPAGKDPKKTAVERLLATNREVGPSQKLIPRGTKLLGFEVKDGTAFANFSKELVDNFEGGQSSEEMLVGAIVKTLTQFKDVKQVQILVDGKKIDSIGDHLDVSEPLTADSLMIGQGEDN